MNKISYAGYRFPPEIIHRVIWHYLRFTLSFPIESGLRSRLSSCRGCAVVSGDQRVEHLFAPDLERGQRTGFIGLHQPGEADHVGGEDRGQAALRALFSHAMR